MSRADLLLQLVQSGCKGDTRLFKKVVEALIAEERSKQHNVLADKLEENLRLLNSSKNQNSVFSSGSKNEDNRSFLLEKEPVILFDDLVINSKTRKYLDEFIEEKHRSDLLRSYGLEPRNRILLVGPPGNGKTSIAEAIASSLLVPFFSVRYENIVASYLGETSTRLKSMFDYIRTQQCVLFFDEFDAIGKERGDVHETGEIKRVVSNLLLQIDQLPSYVTIIAATNHPELLDRAVWRRFQLKLDLPRPTILEITKFLIEYQKKYNLEFGMSANDLATRLKGFSFSEVKDFCDDIIRKYVLGLPSSSKNLRSITSDLVSRIKPLNLKP